VRVRFIGVWQLDNGLNAPQFSRFGGFAHRLPPKKGQCSPKKGPHHPQPHSRSHARIAELSTPTAIDMAISDANIDSTYLLRAAISHLFRDLFSSTSSALTFFAFSDLVYARYGRHKLLSWREGPRCARIAASSNTSTSFSTFAAMAELSLSASVAETSRGPW
jgi:hypothetical protein